MGLRINQNIAAMNAYHSLSVTDGQMSKSLEKLSSGFRINRAADDAAGLSISEGLRAQINGLKVAVRNAQDGISVVQTAEGAMTEVHSILQRMRSLAVQSANEGAADTNARNAAAVEVEALSQELDRIATSTKYGATKLLDGNFNGTFQIGANSSDTLSIGITTGMALASLFGGANLATFSTTMFSVTGSASTFIGQVDTAISAVSDARAKLGAVQNRFEHTIANLSVAVENLSASESRIRDTDMAEEMVQFTRSQILQQAGTAMLAQANQAPQAVLSLLRG
jgi:flagellin